MAAMTGATRSEAILAQLVWRNRIVDLLRLAVPIVGAMVFVGLVGQIMLASLMRPYGVAGLRIDRGNLVVESPQYSGLGSDGARYLVRAREARMAVGQSGRIDMTDVSLDLARPARAALHATAAAATADTSANSVTVPGLTIFHSDDGMRGTLTDMVAQMGSSDLVSEGPVEITFGDGTKVTGASMVRTAASQTWAFTTATLIMPDLPRAAFPPIPFVRGLWVVK